MLYLITDNKKVINRQQADRIRKVLIHKYPLAEITQLGHKLYWHDKAATMTEDELAYLRSFVEGIECTLHYLYAKN